MTLDPTRTAEPDDDTSSSPPLEHLEPADRRALYERARRQGADARALQQLSFAELAELCAQERLDVRAEASTSASTGAGVHPDASRRDLLFALHAARCARAGLGYGGGVLEVLPEGFGFLRDPAHGFAAGPDDVYVSASQIWRLRLRSGHAIHGPVRAPRRTESYLALLRVEGVDDGPVEALRARVPFDQRVPVLPTRRLPLEHPGAPRDARCVDLLAPWGRGQRVLLLAPPRSGRMQLLAQLAAAAAAANPDLSVHVCLVDARPEDVTATARAAGATSELVATTFDQPPARHLAVVDLALQRCQRLCEAGRDVLLLLDSLTTLSRASQRELPPGGRLLVPGLEPQALLRGKKVFAAARNLEGGGSLTVIATAGTGTGAIDDAIAAEFRGKGNAELVLDRDLAALHAPVPIDVAATGTRREDLLLPPTQRRGLARLRAELLQLEPAARADRLVALLAQHADNAALLAAFAG
ncbi:MAG: transcription termination factor Rho [Planctomycetota bacterium]